MKSRRALQIVVAVLSIVVLVGLALSAALVVVAKHIDVMPQQILDFTERFNSGLQDIAEPYQMAIIFGAPALLLLLGIILLLVKKGKEAKNIVGCAFAVVAVLGLAVFFSIFADQLFGVLWTLIVWLACGGVAALFVLFACLSIFLRPKRTSVTVFTEAMPVEDLVSVTVEDSEEADTAVEQEASTEVETAEEEVESVEEAVEEPEAETEEVEKAPEEATPETPATQYVPNLGVTIHDIVEKTYGEGVELSDTTLKKIAKVRSLYQAKAISEQEYVKLMRKYLDY